VSNLADYQDLHANFVAQNLSLDLTRGKPNSEQLDLSDALDGILKGNYLSQDGTDARNYGGLDGFQETKTLGSWLLDTTPDNVLVGGNSSLTLMYLSVLFHKLHHPDWQSDNISFICPVPGYDRHFTICESLGIKMINVPTLADGPDMDAIDALLAEDKSIKGIWCVPKYQNPTGYTYSDATVERIAAMAQQASSGFKVFWDNAYAVHDFDSSDGDQLKNVFASASALGTEDSIIMFASTSKISHAGSGLAFMGASTSSLAFFKNELANMSIGPDKVNQLRHAALFPTREALSKHMAQHALIIKPRINAVLDALKQELSQYTDVSWTEPKGGYFITFYAAKGTATRIVELAAEAGVKLTPAGATHPYGKDEDNSVIRIAPTFPSTAELELAMQVFCNCVKVASAE